MKTNNNLEYRNFNLELRSLSGDSRTIEGYALKFNVESRVMYDYSKGEFTEIIDPRALDQDILMNSDVLALVDHNPSRGVLARYTAGNGTLQLIIDDTGLLYRYDAPNTMLGNELIESIKRGDIRNSSFSFRVLDDRYEKRADGSILRTILKFESIHDVSAVYHPAYPDTSVSKRSLEQINKLKNPEQKKDLKSYYKKLHQNIDLL